MSFVAQGGSLGGTGVPSLALVEVKWIALNSLHLNGGSLEGPWASLDVLGGVLGGPWGRLVGPAVAFGLRFCRKFKKGCRFD